MRLIHAVRDLNAENPTADPIRTIALYTDAEPTAMFVREADVSYSLGPAAARPYLDYDRLEIALLATRADAVWVGWGFVAEDPKFAELCARLGVTFIGPSAEAMRQLGDKIGSKLIAERVGVPVAPWSRGARRHPRRRDRVRRKHRLPGDAQGDGRRRRPRHPGRPLGRGAARGLPAHARRSRSRVRCRRGVPRAPGHRRAARRGAGDRRQPRHGLGAGRTRLLGAAAQPEGDRGVVVAAADGRADRRAEGVGRGAGPRGRLLRRRHGRVPLPPRREVVRVPRGEHPSAGRAPDHRDHHRHRPGPAAAARRRRRPAGRCEARPRSGTPSRPA